MAPSNKELILAGLVLLVIPLFAEVALRLSHFPFEPELYAPNRERGWTPRPGAEGVVDVETRQRVRINREGFRDRERAYEKPADTVRVALLGNSWTEALQVPLEKTYGAVLERLLNERSCFPGKRVEVLNFGVAGYSTAQELLLLQQEVWKYHPDVVMLAFYPARDISNNVRELNNTVNPEQSPYFDYEGGKLVLDDSFRSLPALQERQMQLRNLNVRVAQNVLVLQAINALQRSAKMQVALATAREKAGQAGVGNLEYSIYAPPAQPALEKAWRVTGGLLVAMRDEAWAHGASLRVVTLATRPQVLPDAAKRRELENKLGVQNLDYADKRICKLGEREGIPITNLAPALSEYADSHHVYLNGFSPANFGSGHWNETGHRLAAEIITKEMCATAENPASAVAATP